MTAEHPVESPPVGPPWAWFYRHPYLTVAMLDVLSILAIWSIGFFPFAHEPDPGSGQPVLPGLSLIHRFWDGPSYAMTALTWYDVGHPIEPVLRDMFWSASALPVHLGLYPALIRLFAPAFGYWNGMLAATMLSSVAAFLMLYHTLQAHRLVRDPLWTTVLFLFLPPRWLIYHSVGATEPPFLFFILCALHFYRQGLWVRVGLAGGLAAVTRIYGVLLFPALMAAELVRAGSQMGWKANAVVPPEVRNRLIKGVASLALIPAFLACHFVLFQLQIGNFFAYFSINNATLTPIPYGGFFNFVRGRYQTQADLGRALLYMVVFYGLVWLLRRRMWDLFFVSLFLVIPNLFQQLPDHVRFLIPALPFVILIPLDEVLTRKETRWALLLSLPIIYGYAWGGILQGWSLMEPRYYEAVRPWLE